MKAHPKLKLSAVLQRGALAILAVACAACGGAFGTANPTSPGNTSPVPQESTLWVLGTPGTPFQALVTDSSQSWTIRGVVPESVVIINGNPGVQMTVTKLSNNSALVTSELISGTNLVAEVSTTDPFGTTVVQTFGGLTTVAPAANPNIQFFLKGPSGGLLTGLVEDLSLSFVFDVRSPSLLLFEHPDARVDAIINSTDEAGMIIVDILTGGTLGATGALGATASGGPRVLIKFP